jgi:hypothetical protein
MATKRIAKLEIKLSKSKKARIITNTEVALKAFARHPLSRCAWGGDSEEMIKYHDEEWGVFRDDDVYLFEMLILEGPAHNVQYFLLLD